MKSLTGKFTSVGGWAPLLALLLGAGLMISACGDEEVPTPTTPAPTPAPTPTPTPTPTPPPDPEPTGPATPSNLRVSAATSSSITWTWDAVEGVLAYQGQFSTDSTFTESDQTRSGSRPPDFPPVENLSGNMTGHFRVRSGTGTSLTDLSYSEWSDGTPGTTRAPPAAVALAAPGDLRTSDPENDSIVLDWDEVDDAETYEVEQREDGASSWSDATCGDGNNEVDDTTCVASGLTAATSYDFRVRAVPASSDEHQGGKRTGVERPPRLTTGTAVPPPPITGGSDDLNLQWSSDATAIEWDLGSGSGPVGRGHPELRGPLTETSQKCPALTVGAAGALEAATRNESWIDQESTISADVPITEAGVTRGLCVVRTWEDDREVRQFGDVQLAWAATPPAYPAGTDAEPNPSMRRPSSDRSATQSVTWKFETDMDVGYARVLSASRNDGEQLPGSCNAGDSASAPAAATTNSL